MKFNLFFQGPTLQLLIRHFLTTLGGTFIGAGIVSTSDWDLVVGAFATLAGVAMSAYEKRKRAK